MSFLKLSFAIIAVALLLCSCKETDKNLSLMNETVNSPSRIAFMHSICIKSGKRKFSSDFQKKYLKEKLKWEELKPGSELCWNKFAQFFVFPKPVKFSVKSYLNDFNESEIKKLAKAFETNIPSDNKKYEYKISLEKNAIEESFDIKIPCVMLARRKSLNSNTIVISCTGKIFVSNAGVSDKNSSWIQGEVIKFYEPPNINIEIKE